MSDLFDGAICEADERTQLAEEARRTKESYRNIGYKQGLGDARREETVQNGFDKGFHQGALISFCRAFAQYDPQVESALDKLILAEKEIITDDLMGLYNSIIEYKLSHPPA